jgi:hypothetical protein
MVRSIGLVGVVVNYLVLDFDNLIGDLALCEIFPQLFSVTLQLD